MARFDVVQLDRKNIRRALQFFVSEYQRRRMPFPHPPFRHSVQSFKVSCRSALHEAHNIQIGMVRLKFARNGGPVEHGGLQVVTRSRLQLLYDLFEFSFHLPYLADRTTLLSEQKFARILPTSARPATTRRSPSKSAETSATATEAAATKTAATPATATTAHRGPNHRPNPPATPAASRIAVATASATSFHDRINDKDYEKEKQDLTNRPTGILWRCSPRWYRRASG